MRGSSNQYHIQMKYWSGIIATILFFGASLGYVGTRHAQSLPKLALSTTTVEERFTGIQTKITDLDTRLTVIEHKDDHKVQAK